MKGWRTLELVLLIILASASGSLLWGSRLFVAVFWAEAGWAAFLGFSHGPSARARLRARVGSGRYLWNGYRLNRPSMAPAQTGAMNEQASGRGHSRWCRDYGDAWRAELRLQGLARSDQVTQNRLNSTPIAKRGPWRWPNAPKRIPWAQSGGGE